MTGVCSLCGDPPHPADTSVCPRTGTPMVMTGPCGTTIDRYRVDRWLGTGGMGSVYQAQHLHLGQPVAMKMLHPHLAGSATVVERFVREARAAAAIGNRHIVRIFDFGMAPSGQPFFVMELLEGADLESIVEAGAPFPVGWTLDIVLQLLNGLAAAHAAGVVHRDLKPGNVFLTGVPGTVTGSGDFVKILDFGISKLADETRPSITRTGAILGTPAYMAPEQARGHRDLDHRVDLYSVCVILYELLSAKLPYDGETYEDLLVRVCTEPPVSLREVAPEVGDDLLAVVERGLGRDPAARFQSARELAEALLAVKVPEGDPSSIIPMPGLTGAMRSYRPIPSGTRPSGPSYVPLGSVPAPEPPASRVPPTAAPHPPPAVSVVAPAAFASTLESRRTAGSGTVSALTAGAPPGATPALAAVPAAAPATARGAGTGVWIALAVVSVIALAALSALAAIGLSQLRGGGADAEGPSSGPTAAPGTTARAPAPVPSLAPQPPPQAPPPPLPSIPGMVVPPNGIASLLPMLGIDPDEVASLPGPVQSAPPPTDGVGIGIPFSNSGVDALSASATLEAARPALLACRQAARSITVRVAAIVADGRVENTVPAWDNTGDLAAVSCVGTAFRTSAGRQPLRGSGIVQFEVALGPAP